MDSAITIWNGFPLKADLITHGSSTVMVVTDTYGEGGGEGESESKVARPRLVIELGSEVASEVGLNQSSQG